MLQYMSCTDNMYMYKFQQLNPTIDTYLIMSYPVHVPGRLYTGAGMYTGIGAPTGTGCCMDMDRGIRSSTLSISKLVEP